MHNLMPAEAGSHSPFGREDWKPRVIWRHPLRQALRPQARKAAGSLVHRLETAIGLSRERCLAASIRHTSVMRGPVRFTYHYFASRLILLAGQTPGQEETVSYPTLLEGLARNF